MDRCHHVFDLGEKMNPGKEQGKEGGDEGEVAGGGALPAGPECLLRRCLPFESLWGADCLPWPLYKTITLYVANASDM